MKRKRKTKRPARIRGGVGAIFGALLLLASCSADSQAVPELLDPVGVQQDTAEAVRQDCYSMTAYAGAVSPGREEVLYPQDGTVAEIYVCRGETVQKGQVLARMDLDQWKEEAQRLEEQLRQLQEERTFQQRIAQAEQRILEIERQRLQEEGKPEEAREKQQEIQRLELSSQQQEEDWKAEESRLQEQLREAREKAGNAELTAPCDGTVLYTAPSFVPSSLVQKDSVALYVSNEANPVVICQELMASGVRDAVKILGRTGETEYELTYLPYTSEETMAYALDGIQPPALLEGRELPACGSYISVQVYASFREAVITVPPNAVHKDSDGSYVYCVSEDGKQIRRDVKVGLSTETAVEIQEGLQEGEIVYVAD